MNTCSTKDSEKINLLKKLGAYNCNGEININDILGFVYDYVRDGPNEYTHDISEVLSYVYYYVGIYNSNANEKETRKSLLQSIIDGNYTPESCTIDGCTGSTPSSQEQSQDESVPVDCEMGSWSNVGSCTPNTGSCGYGAGSQSQSRTITLPASNGGTACGSTNQTQSCDLEPCPVDCVEGNDGSWNPCSPTTGTCGSGTQTRERTGDVGPSNGGSACRPTSETQGCEVTCPPVDCQLGSWSAFGTCSPTTGTCGSGTQTRTRPITLQASNGGTACGPTSETQTCDTECGARVNFCVPWQTRWCPGATNELTCKEYQTCRLNGDSKGTGKTGCGGEKYQKKYYSRPIESC